MATRLRERPERPLNAERGGRRRRIRPNATRGDQGRTTLSGYERGEAGFRSRMCSAASAEGPMVRFRPTYRHRP